MKSISILDSPLFPCHTYIVVYVFFTCLTKPTFNLFFILFLKVKTSQEVCVEAKKPSMGFAESCGAAFEYGPKKLRPWANFARYSFDVDGNHLLFTGARVKLPHKQIIKFRTSFLSNHQVHKKSQVPIVLPRSQRATYPE